MIVFGSQRGGGADLATHLCNTEDNAYVERIEGRGSVADDTHGAFAEWEAIAHAMTRCQNYMYSLSINPDPAQGKFTHEQYMDYINRAEAKLGLQGQDREIYWHIKPDKYGNLRDHYHCIWFRIDVQECKAIPISFDKSKLMMVTREFARDHNLVLPDGYETGRAKADQLSLYDKAQMDQTGLTKEERMDIITDLWRASDNAQAFIAGLEAHGYMLASGRRPYVLVDIYGHTNALPRMISDKTVRQKDVLAFLEKDFPKDALPSVEEAKEMAAAHYAERKDMRRAEEEAAELAALERSQEKRADALQAERAQLETRQQAEKQALAIRRTGEQDALSKRHASQAMQVEFERARNTPKGIAGFFARYTGYNFVRSQLHRREDRLRESAQALERERLAAEQEQKTSGQTRLHQLQMMEQRRKEQAQQNVFARERRSLQTKSEQARARAYRSGHDHMPALHLTLTPGGRKAMPHRAARRYTSTTVKELNVKAQSNAEENNADLREDFFQAARRPKKSRSSSSKEPGAHFNVDGQDRNGGRGR